MTNLGSARLLCERQSVAAGAHAYGNRVRRGGLPVDRGELQLPPDSRHAAAYACGGSGGRCRTLVNRQATGAGSSWPAVRVLVGQLTIRRESAAS